MGWRPILALESCSAFSLPAGCMGAISGLAQPAPCSSLQGNERSSASPLDSCYMRATQVARRATAATEKASK